MSARIGLFVATAMAAWERPCQRRRPRGRSSTSSSAGSTAIASTRGWLQSLAGTQAPDFDDTLENAAQAENVDPAATVVGLFGLGAPAGNQGRFLSEAFALKRLPGRRKPARPGLRVRRAGGGRGDGCRTRRYRALLSPKDGTFRVRLGSRGRKRTLARATQRTRVRFRVGEHRRWRVITRQRAASGKFSARAARRIDLRRAW